MMGRFSRLLKHSSEERRWWFGPKWQELHSSMVGRWSWLDLMQQAFSGGPRFGAEAVGREQANHIAGGTQTGVGPMC